MAAAPPACGCASSPIPRPSIRRFLVDEAKLDRIAALIEAWWPERIAPADLADPALPGRVAAARSALLSTLDLGELA